MDNQSETHFDLRHNFPGGEFENGVGAEGDVLRARKISRRNYLIGVRSALPFSCGPIFVCSCCHQKLFENQVEQLKIKIESQKNELQEQASIVSMKSNEIEQGNEKLEEAIANNSAESNRLKKYTEDLSKQIETVKEDLRQKTFENEKFAEENQKLKTDLKLHKQETEAR